MYHDLLFSCVEVDLGVLAATRAYQFTAALEKAKELIAFRTSYLGHNTPPLL